MIKTYSTKKKFLFLYAALIIIILSVVKILVNIDNKSNSPENALNIIQNRVDDVNSESLVISKYISLDSLKSYQNDSITFIITKESIPVYWNYSSRIDSFSFYKNIDNEISKYFYRNNDTFFYCIKTSVDSFDVVIFDKIFDIHGNFYTRNQDSDKFLYSFPFKIEVKESNDTLDYRYHISTYQSDSTPVSIYDVNYYAGPLSSFLLHIVILSLMLVMPIYYRQLYRKFNKYAVWLIFFMIQMLSIYLVSVQSFNVFGFRNSDFFQTLVFSFYENNITLGQAFYISLMIFTSIISFYNNIFKYYIKESKEKLIYNFCLFLNIILYFVFVLPFIINLIQDNQNLYLYYDFSRVDYKSIIALLIIIINVISIVLVSYSIIPFRKFRFTLLQKILIVIVYLFSYLYFVWRFEDIDSRYYEYAFVTLLFFIFVSFTLPSIIKSNAYQKNRYFKLLSLSGFLWLLVISSWISNIIFISNFQKERMLRKEIANSLIISNDHVSEFKLQQKLDQWMTENRMQFDGATMNKIMLFSAELFTNFNLEKLEIYNNQTLPKYLEDMKKIENYTENSFSALHSSINLNTGKYTLIYEIEKDDSSAENHIILNFIIPSNYASKKLSVFNEKSSYSTYYSVAVFYKDRILSITGVDENPKEFEQNLHTEGFKPQMRRSFFTLNFDNDQTVVIKYNRIVLLQYFTTLSYCIIILYFFSIILIYSNNKKNLSIRLEYKDKINVGIISIVTIAFVVLSFISLMFLYAEFDKEYIRNAKQIKSNYDNYVSRISILLNENLALESENVIQDILTKFPYLNENTLKSEVEFYSVNGVNENNGIVTVLDYTVLEHLQKYLSENDSQESNRQVSQTSMFYEDEENLYYFIQYKTEENGILMFSVPDNNTQSQFSINNIITILINTYVLLFLLSIIVTMLIVNNLTKGVQALTQQIRKFSLTKNTPINYEGNDEIAVLVKEYNSMLKNVEIMAENLADSERESAWREAAKQVAHEINNPITPIKLNIQYLIKEAENDKDISALFLKVSKSIIHEIDILSQISESFSTYGRMVEPVFERIDIIHHVKSVITILYVDLSIDLTISHPDDPIYVNADAKFLNIAFMNIIKNAFQAIDNVDNPALKVTIESDSEQVIIKIQDNGVGMSDEIRKKMFVPNFTTKTSGKGIGLSTTKSMIVSMNGNIYVTSKLGEGTTFTVKFPTID